MKHQGTERHERMKAELAALRKGVETRGAKARLQTGSVELGKPSRRALMLRDGERSVGGIRLPLDV